MQLLGYEVLKSLMIKRITSRKLVLHLLKFWYLMFTSARLRFDLGHSASCVQRLNQASINVNH